MKIFGRSGIFLADGNILCEINDLLLSKVKTRGRRTMRERGESFKA